MRRIHPAAVLALSLCAHAAHAEMTDLSVWRYASAVITTSDDPTSAIRFSEIDGRFNDALSIWGNNPLWGSAAATLDFDSNLTSSEFQLESVSTVEASSFSPNLTRAVTLHIETIRFTLTEITTFAIDADLQNDAGFSGSTYIRLADQDPTLDPIYESRVVNDSALVSTSITLDPGLYEFEFWGSSSVVELTGNQSSASFAASVDFRIIPAPSPAAMLIAPSMLLIRRRR